MNEETLTYSSNCLCLVYCFSVCVGQEATTGRDKVLRLVAYFSKYVIHVMKNNDISPGTVLSNDTARLAANSANRHGRSRGIQYCRIESCMITS